MSNQTLLFALEKYRVTVRDLWNTCFYPPTIENIDTFNQIEALLYRTVVTSRLSSTSVDLFKGEPYEPVLKPPFAKAALKASLRRLEDGVFYWDEVATLPVTDDMELVFLGFFDWNQRGLKEMLLARVKIVNVPGKTDLVGRIALIEWGAIMELPEQKP